MHCSYGPDAHLVEIAQSDLFGLIFAPERPLFPIADVQITKNRVKIEAAFGHKQTIRRNTWWAAKFTGQHDVIFCVRCIALLGGGRIVSETDNEPNLKRRQGGKPDPMVSGPV